MSETPLDTREAERIAARQDEILGKPPRMAPMDREANADLITESSLRLRRGAVSGDVKPLPLDQVHEIVVTLLRHPNLWESICAVSIELLGPNARLPARERELAVMRV